MHFLHAHRARVCPTGWSSISSLRVQVPVLLGSRSSSGSAESAVLNISLMPLPLPSSILA